MFNKTSREFTCLKNKIQYKSVLNFVQNNSWSRSDANKLDAQCIHILTREQEKKKQILRFKSIARHDSEKKKYNGKTKGKNGEKKNLKKKENKKRNETRENKSTNKHKDH